MAQIKRNFNSVYNEYHLLVYNVALNYAQNIEDAEEITQAIGGEYKLKYGTTVGLSGFYDDKVSPQKNDRIVLVTKLNVSIDGFLKKLKKNKKKALKKENEQNEEIEE